MPNEPNQWHTPCEVKVYEENEEDDTTHRFSDLQAAYLWVKEQLELRFNGDGTIRSFERTVERLGRCHPRGYTFAWRDRVEYTVFYCLESPN